MVSTIDPSPVFPPAPWSFRAARQKKSPLAQVLDSTGLELATVCGYTLAEVNRTARLIAATPDLLHACLEVVEAWDHGDLAEAARMCQAAVWRAKGFAETESPSTTSAT